MAGLQPFNLGNVLAQGEGILNAREQRNPNSLNNQLLQAKLNNLNSPGAVDPTANMRDIEFLRKMKAEGYPDAEIQLMEDAIAKRWYGDVAGVQGSAQGGTFAPMTNIQDIAANEAFKSYMKSQGQLQSETGNTLLPPQQTFGGSGLSIASQPAPVSKADITRDVKQAEQDVKAETEPGIQENISKSKVVGAARGEYSTPEYQQKMSTRLKDNEGVINTIDGLLSPRADGKGLRVSYAYGKENVYTNDFVKPQEWIDAEAERDRVVASLQLENVQKLKGTGPITENEQKILADAASALKNYLISPKLAEKELRRAKTMFQKWSADNRRMLQEGKGLYLYDDSAQEEPTQNYTEGQTATNPQTGQKLIFKGGAWQAME